jgi:TolB-like protein/predicted Zn-dependent protease
VLNTVALYIVGAWVALQVSELLFPALDVPERAIRYVWLGAILVFPLVLVFAWRYDISSGRIKRTPALDEAEDADRSLHTTDRWYIGSLGTMALAVIGFMAVLISRVEPEPEVLLTSEESSIAVLPMTVCEGQADQQPLAEGLTGEIISRLAGRDRIEVIGRVSSLGIAALNLPAAQTADLLGVDHLLSGMLCREEVDLTLEAELRDAEGFVVWRERFTQVVNRFDQVEQRLSSQVARGVAAEFGDLLPSPADPPVHPLALRELLEARAFRWRSRDEEARTSLERALEIQPDYAEAVFELLRLERIGPQSHGNQERTARANALTDRALVTARRHLQQDSGSADAHYVLARIIGMQAWGSSEDTGQAASEAALAEAKRHLRSAITIDPSMADAYRLLVLLLPRTRTTERLEILQRGIAIEPFDTSVVIDLAQALLDLGRYREAMEQLQRFREPLEVPDEVWKFRMHQQRWYGYNDELLATSLDLLRSRPPGSLVGTRLAVEVATVATVLAGLGLIQEAEAWWIRCRPVTPDADGIGSSLYSRHPSAAGRGDQADADQMVRLDEMTDDEIMQGSAAFVLERAYHLADGGQLDRAIRLLERARASRHLDERQGRQADLRLAYLYERDGRPEEAATILAGTATELEKLAAAGIRDRWTLRILAGTYAVQGRSEEALRALARAIDYHAYEQQSGVRSSWFKPFAGLEDNSQYQAIQRRVEIDLERQAESIRGMLAGLDMDELLAPVMTARED